jgi:hypothetical protein
MANRKKRFIYYSSPDNWFQAALELNEAANELIVIKENRTVFRPIISKLKTNANV